MEAPITVVTSRASAMKRQLAIAIAIASFIGAACARDGKQTTTTATPQRPTCVLLTFKPDASEQAAYAFFEASANALSETVSTVALRGSRLFITFNERASADAYRIDAGFAKDGTKRKPSLSPTVVDRLEVIDGPCSER